MAEAVSIKSAAALINIVIELDVIIFFVSRCSIPQGLKLKLKKNILLLFIVI